MFEEFFKRCKMNKDDHIKSLKDQGTKIIPIKYGTKVPDVLKLTPYLDGKKIYQDDILPGQNYGVICGSISDNLVILDFEKIHPDDYRNKVSYPRHLPVEPEFLNKFMPDYLNQTFTTRTGSGATHILLKGDEIPKTTASYEYVQDHENIYHLDLKVSGYCVEAGSMHENGKLYELVSNVTTIKKMDLQFITMALEKAGFKPLSKSKVSSMTLDDYNNWTIEELQKGGWGRGERRRKQKSLYCKLRRIKKKEIQEIKDIINKINQELDTPLEHKELEINFEEAEKFFQNEVLPKLGYVEEDTGDKLFGKKEWPKVAKKIQDENHFVTLRENGDIWFYDVDEKFYKPLGDTVIAELAQELIYQCKTNVTNEITNTIRRNKTMIYTKELFESKYINSINNILDPKTFEIKEHSPEYLTINKFPFSINYQARNLKLWNHILSIIDPGDINKLMELIWMAIRGENPFKKTIVFKGITNTQKSTLVFILTWIIGAHNISNEKPEKFLGKFSRFDSSKFIGKKMNVATEIGEITQDMVEKLKALVGGEIQNTERKNDPNEYLFDPTKFVFLFTTNELGDFYHKIDDDSTIDRFEFMIFRNQLVKKDGLWYTEFFKDEEDKQTAIDTIMNIIIHYKKAQMLGKIPKTRWSSISETIKILRQEMSPEDRYFSDQRLIRKEGARLSMEAVKSDFQNAVKYKVTEQMMGNILKRRGIESKQSNGVTWYVDVAFDDEKDQTKLIV